MLHLTNETICNTPKYHEICPAQSSFQCSFIHPLCQLCSIVSIHTWLYVKINPMCLPMLCLCSFDSLFNLHAVLKHSAPLVSYILICFGKKDRTLSRI